MKNKVLRSKIYGKYISAPQDINVDKMLEIFHFSESIDDAYVMTESDAIKALNALKVSGTEIVDITPTTKDIVLEEEARYLGVGNIIRVTQGKYEGNRAEIVSKGDGFIKVKDTSGDLFEINESSVVDLSLGAFEGNEKYQKEVSDYNKSKEKRRYVDNAMVDDSDDEAIIEREREKMDLIRDVVEFDEVKGDASPVQVNRLFLKDGKVLFQLLGHYVGSDDTMPTILKNTESGEKSTFNYHPYAGLGDLDQKKFKNEFGRAYDELFHDSLVPNFTEDDIEVYTEMFELATSANSGNITEARNWYNELSEEEKNKFTQWQLEEATSDMATFGINDETGEVYTLDEIREGFEGLIAEEDKGLYLVQGTPKVEGKGKYWIEEPTGKGKYQEFKLTISLGEAERMKRIRAEYVLGIVEAEFIDFNFKIVKASDAENEKKKYVEVKENKEDMFVLKNRFSGDYLQGYHSSQRDEKTGKISYKSGIKRVERAETFTWEEAKPIQKQLNKDTINDDFWEIILEETAIANEKEADIAFRKAYDREHGDPSEYEQAEAHKDLIESQNEFNGEELILISKALKSHIDKVASRTPYDNEINFKELLEKVRGIIIKRIDL